MRRLPLLALVAAAAAMLPGAAHARTTDRAVQRAVQRAVELGYPGVAVATHRDGRDRLLTRGVADRQTKRRWSLDNSMRIASVSKALNGAVVLSLVRDGKLRLDDTVGRLLPGVLPQADAVTVAQLLQHTGGVPAYTSQPGFNQALSADPLRAWTPAELIAAVDGVALTATPGTRYEYSNTDNILLGQIAAAVGGRSYSEELQARVAAPLGLKHTFLAENVRLPRGYVHGYLPDGKGYEDVSEELNPTMAGASGGVVSTPRELGAFMRGLASGRLYGRALVGTARAAVRPGDGDPPGPGVNGVALGVFRYRLPCGVTMWGHSGTFPGYRQWAAASPSGGVSVVVGANAPAGAISKRADAALRRAQALAACRAMGR
jgi:D-alanyl-D-alanine carboxypeptidase